MHFDSNQRLVLILYLIQLRFHISREHSKIYGVRLLGQLSRLFHNCLKGERRFDAPRFR